MNSIRIATHKNIEEMERTNKQKPNLVIVYRINECERNY